MRILIVVDMQNDFIDGALGSPDAQAIVPVMEKRMTELADGDTALFYTQDTHFEDYLDTQEGRLLPVPHCMHNSFGWKINERINNAGLNEGFVNVLDDENGGHSFTKLFFGYYELPCQIEDLMSFDDFNEIILMGVCTDICVVSNAMILKSYFPEVKITVDASCCAGTTPENHKAALQIMKSCQINVINEDNEELTLRVTNKESNHD